MCNAFIDSRVIINRLLLFEQTFYIFVYYRSIEESLLALETFILTLWRMHQILVIIQKQDQSIILNAII
jgi:hypothetical protein